MSSKTENGAQGQAPTTPQNNGASPQAAFHRSASNHSEPRPQAGLSDERAIIRTLIEHPRKLASQLLDKLEVIDFQQPSHALIIKAAKECKADNLDTTDANIEATLTKATGDAATVEERSGLIEAIATLQEIELEEYSEETGETAKRHADKLAADFEKRLTATTTAPAYKLHSFKDLAKIPRLQWLIRGILLETIASALTAKSGDFKSFIALCMALCIATGRAFFGHEVKQGAVVYVAAEGFYTMLDRATAWAQFHDCELPENFHIVKAPVNLADARVVAAFMESIETAKPVFVVLDTLSQCAIGMNENDNAAMADFVRGMMSLGNAIGAHVQVLHHNAKATGTFRGAGSFGANLDAHISLDRPENDEEGNTIFVRCEKQRGKSFEPFALRGEEVFLPYADEYGDPISALVFEPCGEVVTAKVEKHANAKRADKTRAALMEVFDRQFDEAAAQGFEGVKVGFWKEAVENADAPICSERAFWAHRKILENDGTIEQNGSHNGSPTFHRGSKVKGSTATTATTATCSTCTTPISEGAEYCNNCTIPLGSAVLAVPAPKGRKSDNALPEMPKAKQAKKKNAKADGEAYKGKSEEF